MKSVLLSCFPLVAFMVFAGGAHRSPDYTATLTGRYIITYMNWDGDIFHLPERNFTGSIRTVKRDGTHLDMIFSVKASGNGRRIDETSDPQTVEIRPNTGNSFFLFNNGVKLGTITSKGIVIRTATENGKGLVTIKACRQRPRHVYRLYPNQLKSIG